jgi:hypothetical protein
MTGLTLTASDAVDICPKGNYAGTIKNVEIVEQQSSQFGDGPQVKITVGNRAVIFATPNPPTGNVPRQSDRPEWWVGKDIWAYANPSLGKKTKLRQWFEGITGRTLSDDEVVDLNELIGKPVVYTVGRTSTGRHKVTDFVRDDSFDKPADGPAPTGQDVTPRQMKALEALGRTAQELDDRALELFDSMTEDLNRRQMAKLIESFATDDDDAPDFD